MKLLPSWSDLSAVNISQSLSICCADSADIRVKWYNHVLRERGFVELVALVSKVIPARERVLSFNMRA